MPGIRAGKPRRHLRGAPVPGRPKSGDGGGRRAADEVTPEKGHGGLLATSSTAPRPSLPPRSVSSILLPLLSIWSHSTFTSTAHRAPIPWAAGGQQSEPGAGRSRTRPGRSGRGGARGAARSLCYGATLRARRGAAATAPAGRHRRLGGGWARRRDPSREAALSPACVNGIGSMGNE